MRWEYVHRGTALVLSIMTFGIPFTLGVYAAAAEPLAPVIGMVLATLTVNFATIAVALARSLDGLSLFATLAAIVGFVIHFGLGLGSFGEITQTLELWIYRS